MSQTSVERLREVFLEADLESFRGPDAMLGAAEFLIGGGMPGAQKRADSRVRALFEAARSPGSRYRGLAEEEIAKMLIERFDELRTAVGKEKS